MFRLIFVDDEAIIRNGISQVVPWGDNGFDLAGMFEHGQQALDFIKDNPVDVVITDINMPRMDGLTFSKILADQYPKIMVLLLTGYDDFEYARKAVKNQVREFLLKPITADELKEVLVSVKEELSQLKVQELKQEEMRLKLNQSFPLLKERFFNRLISGRLNSDNFLRRKEYFKWRDMEAFYQISLIGVPQVWDELDRITLHEFIKKLKLKTDEVFFNTNENLVLLFQGENVEKLEDRLIKKLEKIFLYAGNLDKELISAGCGEVVDNCMDLHRSYSGAQKAVDYSKVLGLTQILSIKNVRNTEQIIPETFQLMLENVHEQLKEGRKEQTVETMNLLFTYLEKHYISLDEVYSYCSRIHFLIYSFIIEMGILSSEDPFFPLQPTRYLSINEAREAYLKYVSEIEDRIDSRRNDIILSRVDKAKELISRKFNDGNFSLQVICSELFLSTSQFSFLFKEGTGQTFVEYLTAFRVEEAKKLLKSTDLRAYEIAEKVGYRDSRYFSLIFKKLTGLTAMEFRKRLES